jgi:LDH2 family malate/lactate/ureidoglycolate dehydrogenase
MAEIIHVPVEIIQQFITKVFEAVGVPDEDARICADVLIASDLRGIESHGIQRLKAYYDRIQAGVQVTRTQIEIVKETETTAVIDGHHGMGQVIAYQAMTLAIQKAKRYGLGGVAVRHGNHFGIAGYYPLMAAKEGLMGFAVTNARPAIAPTFGTEPMLGTNPIAFAAPSDMPYPFCYDGATSIAQRGKVEVAARIDKPLAPGLVIDAEGNPATNAKKVLDDLGKDQAALLPLGGAGEEFGGHKGFGLSTMVEILSASLGEGMYLKDLLGVAPDGSRRPFMIGHFFLAIDIEHFVPMEVSRCITGGIMRALQESRKAPGHDKIYVAGEKEYAMEKRRREQGIPINANLLQELRTIRDEQRLSGYESYL